MELADIKVAAWLDRGPAHQLFRAVDGRLVYRLLPTSSAELRRGVESTAQRLAAALNSDDVAVPPQTRVHVAPSEEADASDDVLLSCDDVVGRPLSTLLEPLPPVLALGLAARIVRGLQPLHDQGLYHAALAGDRILLRADESVVIADTGMAMVTEADPDRRLAPSVPGFAELYPTPALIPPEVFNWKPLSPASDVFLVGALTYLWMTGAHAHTGNRVMDVYSALRDGRRQPFPTLPANLNLAAIRLLEAALEPDPEARPSTAELAAALRPFAGIPLAPVAEKLDSERRYSDRFDQLSPEDAPGPPGSPAEQRRQEVLKRATLQLEVMKTQRDAGISTTSTRRKAKGGGSSMWSWVLVVLLLVALGALTPVILEQMQTGAGGAEASRRGGNSPGKTLRSDVDASGPAPGAATTATERGDGELLIPDPNAPAVATVRPALGTEPGGLVVTPTGAPRLDIRRRQPEIETHNERLWVPASLPAAP